MPQRNWAYRAYYRVRRNLLRHYDRVVKWVRSRLRKPISDNTQSMSEMRAFKPEISASAVAGLIGMNPYRKPHEVMYQVLQKNKTIKETIRRLENEHRRIPIDVMQRNIANDPDVRKIL